MAKRWAILGGLALTALLAAALMHRSGVETGAGDDAAAGDPAKQRVRRFWELNHRANDLRLAGEFETAISLYRDCLELRPGHEDSLYYLGLSLESVGEFPEAAAVYRRLTRVNPSSNRAFAQLGQLLSTPAPGAVLDFGEAENAYRRCIGLNREHSGPYLNLGRLKLNTGRFAEALGHFRTAAQYGSPEANLLAGYTCLLRGQNDRAREYLQRVLDWYAHENKIAAQGAALEGDLLSGAEGPPSVQQSLAMQASFYRFCLDPSGAPWLAGRTAKRINEAGATETWDEIGAGAGLAAAGRAAWADFDGDGRIDMAVGGQDGHLHLYRNSGSALADVTAGAGLAGVDDFWDAVWGDYDLDGDPDLYVLRSGFLRRGENRLYRNNGDGSFSDRTAQSGLGGVRPAFRARFVDLDQDGRPELVEAGVASTEFAALRIFAYQGNQWLNQTAAWGLDVPGTVAGFAAADYNGDGATDLVVLPWGRPISLLRNRGGGFEDVTGQAGLSGVRGGGFASLFFDYDQDGLPDLLVARHAPFPEALRSLLFPENAGSSSLRLFRNRGRGRFEEVTKQLGLRGAFGTMEARPADVDGDGWPDLILANGSLNALRLEPSVILRNAGGRVFKLSAFLPGQKKPGNAIGVSAADLDGDGRLEIYLAGNPVLASYARAGLYKRR